MKMMETQGWEALMKLVTMTISELNNRQVQGMNAFETLRSLFLKEGKVGGLKEFFDGVVNGDMLSGEMK